MICPECGRELEKGIIEAKDAGSLTQSLTMVCWYLAFLADSIRNPYLLVACLELILVIPRRAALPAMGRAQNVAEDC